jgi:ABC-2 type transport system ATP-binding protein
MSSSTAAADSAPVVQVAGLEKSFGEVAALRGIGFSVPRGCIAGFLGPNGAGKSTAIRILAGYLAADAGSARVCGLDVAAEPLAVKQRIGYLPENNPLWLDMDVAGFLRFAADSRGMRGAAARAAITRVIEQTGLQPVWRRTLGACSKGFRQRAGLAQALLHDPELLILDEPTNGLDPLQVIEMRALVRELGRRKTVILTSHVLPEVEAIADRVIVIHQGRIVADGALAELGRADAQGAVRVRVAIRGSERDLRALLAAAGPRWLERATAPLGGDAACAAWAEAAGTEQIAGIAAAAAAQGVPLLELAPQAGSLEALFRGLMHSEGAAA